MVNRTPIRRSALPRATKPLARLGKRGQAKIDQKRAAKVDYCKAFGGMLEGVYVGPCQHCGKVVQITSADFSHKVPAGRGGDKGGKVHASNGVYSCRACHEFVERSTAARAELIDSPVSMEAGGTVRFSLATSEKHQAFLAAWHGRR